MQLKPINQQVVSVVGASSGIGRVTALEFARRGALIHISSMEGRRSLPYQSAYSSAKHGIEGFLEAMRVELIHEKWPISVTSIKPAVINTPFWNNGLTKLGVKPSGIPPYYDPIIVSDAILYAAEHPIRDLFVGDVAKLLDLAQKVSPSLVDSLLLLVGFNLQHSDEPKSEDAPNNFYQSVPEDNRIDGDYQNLVIPSITDLVAKLPIFQWGAAALLTVLAAQEFTQNK